MDATGGLENVAENQRDGWMARLTRWAGSATRCGFQPEAGNSNEEARVRVRAVPSGSSGSADPSPSDKAEMPAVIQHIVEVVLHHQPATPQALHGIPLSERLHLVTPLRREYANRMPGH